MFCDPGSGNLAELGRRFVTKLPEAESYLDRIAEEADNEARSFAADPLPLLALIEKTRQLSRY
jgi:hypothetical protein